MASAPAPPATARNGSRRTALTVVVPATARHPTLDQCVARLKATLDVDDKLLVIRDPSGASPATARNEGVLAAQTEVVVFVDSDVVVHFDALTRIREAFAADPGLAAIFGSYDDQPHGGTVAVFRNLLHHHVHSRSAGEAETFWAGLGAVRRDRFLRVEGFDAAGYPRPMIEDVDLGIRLRRAGMRVVLDPAIRGTHLKQWTLRGMVRSDIVDRGVPWTRALLRHRRVPATLNLSWRDRASAASVTLGLGASLGRRWRASGLALAILLVVNRDFYTLLYRRLGPRRLPQGVALHILHYACGVLAVPLGVLAHARAASRLDRRAAACAQPVHEPAVEDSHPSMAGAAVN
jgi:glycosyltransferase involved in cell wall biosynthesis